MIRRPSSTAALLSCLLAGGVVVVSSQPPTSQLPLAPLGLRGEAVFPAYEGWGPHKDGTTVLLLGYFNRNKGEALDIPIGPNNRIEPGGPDFGQPTHFRPGRQHGVFGISAPKDFGTKKLTWTIVANGHSSVVSFWTNPQYWIDFFENPADGNEPPVIRFSPTGPTLTGPTKAPVQASLTGTVGQPVPLSLWASDQPETTVHDPNPRPGQGRGRGRGNEPEGDIIINWTKYRGAGDVTIAQPKIPLVTKGDAKLVLEARTTATFSTPGEYWLLATANDHSGDGGGGDQCCWTSAHVKVTVK